jgi:hypothetical protein
MATRRKSHTRRSRKSHTRRSSCGGAGNKLNPNAKPFSRLRGNAPAFVPAPRPSSYGFPNGNAAAAEYASRTKGATIMKPYNGKKWTESPRF